MSDHTNDSPTLPTGGNVADAIAGACALVPPLWDLPNYVAVNPFLGFTGRPLSEAARTVCDGLGADLLPPLAFYRTRWAEGAFDRADLTAAAARAGLDADALEDVLTGRATVAARRGAVVRTFAERHDLAHGTRWADALTRSVARWCAVYASDGGTSWPLPVRRLGLYASWREAETVDRTLEIAGLHGWRSWVKGLPADPVAATAWAVARAGVSDAELNAYLYRLLGGVYGWASHFRRASWEAGSDRYGALAELLAIRACADVAVAELAPRSPSARPVPASQDEEDEPVRAALQDALEDGYVSRLLAGLNAPPTSGPTPLKRPEAQAVFCIDVRSEPFRRHLEAQSAALETRGFAGFFGVAVEWSVGGAPSARCPVLLKPAVRLRSMRDALPRASASGIVKQVQAAPAAAFSFVEVAGPLYALGLAGDALATGSAGDDADGTAPFDLGPQAGGHGVEDATRLDLAHGILIGTGLASAAMARLVLLCGHVGRSANNAHAAGLDCGACGGHGGAINARVAVTVLNDPAVRAGLRARGVDVPSDTWFVAGVHDTSTDTVTLLDAGRVPPGHTNDLHALGRRLAKAGELTRVERAVALGIEAGPAGRLAKLLGRRARDWSEVRPEWALARNAAFIAARRARSRGVDLGGRAFLHDYDAEADPSAAVLTLILTAPMVVASWINLQYFASTVDNDNFGCGDKTLHNRVGSIGVVLGNGGDLRTGLPRQSVHGPDGRWFHEPLRLQVVVEASTDQIDRVLSAHASVRDLVDNGWVRLFALDRDGGGARRRRPFGGWDEQSTVADVADPDSRDEQNAVATTATTFR